MDRIYLEELVKFKTGNNKGNIDWVSNIGQSVAFEYKDKYGEILILDFDSQTQYVTVEYNGVSEKLYASNFKKCKIGKLFGVGKYKYNVGDILDTRSGKVEILSQTYLRDGKDDKYREKSYRYKCLNCGYEDIMRESHLYRNCGCIKCNDGVSYPEKYTNCALDQLGIDFEVQKTFKWINRHRYDIYIPSLNAIIEINGMQHYIETGWTNRDEKQNDKYKKDLAITNGIDKYIVIKAEKSNSEYMKNAIIKSKLKNYYDLSNIDWEFCHKRALSSYVKEICDDFSNGKQVEDLIEKFHLTDGTIRSYLKQGNDIGWCVYDKRINYKKGREKSKIKTSRKVLCLTTNKEFNSIVEAANYYCIYKSGIGDCCKGKISYAGKHPETGEAMKWKYADNTCA